MPENIACQSVDSDRLRIVFGEREGIGMDRCEVQLSQKNGSFRCYRRVKRTAVSIDRPIGRDIGEKQSIAKDIL